jgi:hypothetical protein
MRMKKLLLFTLMGIVGARSVSAQNMPEDKSKRPSPPATVTQTIGGGVVVTIDYSQPSVKGRTIGKEIAPYDTVWRTGANEATLFQVSGNVMIEGKELPAGKYCLFTIPTAGTWTIILNSALLLPNGKPTWGAYTYDASKDVLRVQVPSGKSPQWTEKMTFMISKDGKVSLLWGDKEVDFHVMKG